MEQYPQAAGDAAAGEKKAYFCSTCHGADGNATITGTPRLAGMSVKQFTAKMKAYKSGKVVIPSHDGDPDERVE